MPIFSGYGRFTSHFACRFSASSPHQTPTRLLLRCSIAPPNVPRIVANAGGSYRFDTKLPVELGLSARYVGNRFNSDANTVIMDAYTVADAYVFVDIPKYFFPAVDQTRIPFRLRNLFDRRYAIWGDPFYPDQILLGAPRTYEAAVAFKR